MPQCKQWDCVLLDFSFSTNLFKCNRFNPFFSICGVGDLINHHVFNFQSISKRKVNYTQIPYKLCGICFNLLHLIYIFIPFPTNLLNYSLSFCAIAYVGKQHFLWSLAICCMLSLQKTDTWSASIMKLSKG